MSTCPSVMGSTEPAYTAIRGLPASFLRGDIGALRGLGREDTHPRVTVPARVATGERTDARRGLLVASVLDDDPSIGGDQRSVSERGEGGRDPATMIRRIRKDPTEGSAAGPQGGDGAG